MAFSSFGTVFAASSYGSDQEKFAVYYSNKEPAERFSHYQLLVLDRIYHPPLQELSEDGKLLLGYISLGEIEKGSPHYAALKQKNLALQENKNWKGSYYIDLRDPLWQKIIIEEMIPDVLRQGFHGVFFDTLDSPLELERLNPAKYRGMSEAAVHLLEAVRMHYPSLKVMVNRAYAILPDVAPSVDMVLGECILGEYDFDKKSYFRVDESQYMQQVKWLEEAKRHNPELKIYTLDYADTRNRKGIAEIYRLQRARGFIPYVATIGLDEIVDEPAT